MHDIVWATIDLKLGIMTDIDIKKDDFATARIIRKLRKVLPPSHEVIIKLKRFSLWR